MLLKFHGWSESPGIKDALKDGRSADDICVVVCTRCGSVTYYNQGSHCDCEHCGANLDHLLDEDTGEITTLDDLWGCQEEGQVP